VPGMQSGRELLTAIPARTRRPAVVDGRSSIELSRQILRAQEAERARLARELHDELGQALTAVKINLQTIDRGPVNGELRARLSESVEIIEQALRQVRQLSLDLRPALLDACGLETAIRCLLEKLADRTGLSVRFSAKHLVERLPVDVETTCFRIVQEALTNVVRHARATEVSVRLRRFGNCLTFRIADNGTGFDIRLACKSSPCAPGFGLTAMRERAQLIQGRLSITSASGRGTTILGSLPLI
jgi:signal transduction histidine kinase